MYKILLENAHFICKKSFTYINDSPISTNDICILNIFKNPSEIDLENSNLINTPINFSYKFEKLGGNYEDITAKIKALFPNNDYKNDIDDEIAKYRKKYTNLEQSDFFNWKINGFLYERMKISDLFYTFAFDLSKEKFKRLDIIFSKNYDKIFIGVVKNDKTYIKRLILNINTIDKFVMSVEQKGVGFKVLLKETINQNEICNFFHQEKYYLESILFLLNGKLEDINKGISNNCEVTTRPN